MQSRFERVTSHMLIRPKNAFALHPGEANIAYSLHIFGEDLNGTASMTCLYALSSYQAQGCSHADGATY